MLWTHVGKPQTGAGVSRLSRVVPSVRMQGQPGSFSVPEGAVCRRARVLQIYEAPVGRERVATFQPIVVIRAALKVGFDKPSQHATSRLILRHKRDLRLYGTCHFPCVGRCVHGQGAGKVAVGLCR